MTAAPEKPSPATILVGLARASDLWHAPDGDAYATVDMGDHRESWRLASNEYRRWLARLGWQKTGRAAGDSAIRAAIITLSGIAVHDSPSHAAHVRVAGDGDRVWLDLVDERWRAIEIDRNGWRIAAQPALKFVRRSGMAALPEPAPGGSIDELRKHIRVADASWPLIAGWLIGALAPRGPYPVLVLRGAHGTGKSWAARILRSLIDPSIAPIRSEPREPRDLVVSARASHVIALDNLSSLPTWLSDGLCRLASGGGYAARALYTDTDEIVIDVQRPAILTGITDVVTAPDLLDRCLLVELEPIVSEERATERALLAAWTAGPQRRILGALCDAMVTALRRRDQIRVTGLPRLADWAELATAAEPALGLPDGAVIRALKDQADEAVAIALEASLIAQPLRQLMEGRAEWIGTAGELLEAIRRRVDLALQRDGAWPRTARALAGMLARIAPALRASGVTVERLPRGSGGRRGHRPWRIALAPDGSAP
jgi:hypothetical protein